jgi:hypothetical protein
MARARLRVLLPLQLELALLGLVPVPLQSRTESPTGPQDGAALLTTHGSRATSAFALFGFGLDALA